MKRIQVILQKEWAEIFKNRMVIFTVAFLPLMFTVLPLAIIYTMGGDVGMAGSGTEIPAQFKAYCPADMDAGACMKMFMVSQFMLLFMIIPLSIPSAIAAYSIVGEKTSRSLEPLLATPISTLELLLAKSLSAFIPAVLATYASFGLFLLGARIIDPDPSLVGALLNGYWLLGVLVVGPLLALLSVTVSVIISSRVTDARTAEQVAAVVVIPVLGIFFGQMAGLFVLNNFLILVSAVVLAAIDAGMFYLAVQTFQRETILTRWK
jgi:ABC-2 type transport system permease protein